jgi:hypothetical protein
VNVDALCVVTPIAPNAALSPVFAAVIVTLFAISTLLSRLIMHVDVPNENMLIGQYCGLSAIGKAVTK